MKAYVLHDVNNLTLDDVEMPELTPGWALVKVKAAGICGSDIPRIYKDGAHRMPLIPGHEFSGVVESVCEEKDRQWFGKRVGIFPLIPCGKCIPCQKGAFEMCRSYSYLGSRCNGGFAEYAAVPASNLVELPETVSFEAAAMLEPMAVAAHAMRKIAPKPEECVVVCGLGTIGLLLSMFLLQSGVRNLFVIGNKEFQKQQALGLGLSREQYLDGRQADAAAWIQEKTNHAGCDVFFECVGKNETVSLGVNSAAAGGRIMLVGNPYSDMQLEKNTYWKILRNQLTVCGTWNSSFTGEAQDDWQYVLGCLEQNRIHPERLISHTFSLQELQKGFEIMRDKSEDYVKIVMK